MREVTKTRKPRDRYTTAYRFMRSLGLIGNSECLIWPGAIQSNGYGNINVLGKTCTTHRVAFELFKGRIPEGKVIMHTCDNRACCNPEHLVLGTQSENLKDAYAKGRKNVPDVRKKVKELTTGLVFDSLTDATRFFDLPSGAVSQVCSGKRKHTKRKVFKYV